MHDRTHDDTWRDRVADPSEGLGRDAHDWSDAVAGEALAFAEMIVECAVRPVLAMTAALPSLFHYEIREHAQRRAWRARR